MSCILKVAYQCKHKKYRYYRDKPINFHQIKQELSIHHPLKCIHYQIDDQFHQPSSFEENNARPRIFDEAQLSNYLRTMMFEPKQTIKIKIMCKKSEQIREDRSENTQEQEDLQLPIKVERMRSKSDQIDIGKPLIETTDNLQITQQFLCNSHVQWFQVQKSKELEQIELELNQNSRRTKLTLQKRRYTDLQKLLSYWNNVKNKELE